ncbi:hypothetical protein SSX86_012666 [Deinandra increscens subsp. villosa]|uniref:Uncharacterized protein n=1 Tax=Deinandra increscens subsp. villosa TaxID=3103831 RepID=A0AAP0H0U9_9ASTR
MGDFNAVRFEHERFISTFNPSEASDLNHFILEGGLIDLNMGGRRFTFLSSSGDSLSKLDRILICNNYFNRWPSSSIHALPRVWSDHCPVILKTFGNDFGPRPFKCFNSWFELQDFDSTVQMAASLPTNGGKPDKRFLNKLKNIKIAIKQWNANRRDVNAIKSAALQLDIDNLDLVAESRILSEQEKSNRISWKKEVSDLEFLARKDLQQKARVKWTLDGDENSRFFHGIINCSNSKRRINGLFISGVWSTNPEEIKMAALAHFKERFTDPLPIRTSFPRDGFSKLSNLDSASLLLPFSVIKQTEGISSIKIQKQPPKID